MFGGGMGYLQPWYSIQQRFTIAIPKYTNFSTKYETLLSLANQCKFRSQANLDLKTLQIVLVVSLT